MTPPTWPELHAAGVPRPEGVDEVCRSHAESLCQLAAVKFLLDQGLCIGCDTDHRGTSGYTVFSDEPENSHAITHAPDLDTALRAACSASLPQGKRGEG